MATSRSLATPATGRVRARLAATIALLYQPLSSSVKAGVSAPEISRTSSALPPLKNPAASRGRRESSDVYPSRLTRQSREQVTAATGISCQLNSSSAIDIAAPKAASNAAAPSLPAQKLHARLAPPEAEDSPLWTGAHCALPVQISNHWVSQVALPLTSVSRPEPGRRGSIPQVAEKLPAAFCPTLTLSFLETRAAAWKGARDWRSAAYSTVLHPALA